MALTVTLGVFDRSSEQQVSTLSASIFDKAFLGADYLRSAQLGFVRGSARCSATNQAGCAALNDALPDILGNLTVAHDRALSPQARGATAELDASLRVLPQAVHALDPAVMAETLAKLDEAFSAAIETFSSDGYTVRRQVDETAARADRNNLLAIIVSVGAAAGITLVLSVLITMPLHRAILLARAIADGHLTVPAPPRGRSETALLLQALASLAHKLELGRAAEVEAQRLESQSAGLARQARAELASQYEQTVGAAAEDVIRTAAEQAQTIKVVAAQAADAAQGWTAIADATGSTTREAQAVSDAAAQLAMTVAEINRQVGLNARIADHAATAVSATDATVQQLAASAVQIGNVVGLINNIASRTNLLALNATIEAARAGQAGRGFSVVANEVKALAAQTARATAEVRQQIAAMRCTTENVVGAIRDISGTISQLGQVGGDISVAVGQQGDATRGIVSSVARMVVEAGRVEAELQTLAQGRQSMTERLGSLCDVADEAMHQGHLIRRESAGFLSGLQAA